MTEPVDEAERVLASNNAGEELARQLIAALEEWRSRYVLPALAVARAAGDDTSIIGKVVAEVFRSIADELDPSPPAVTTPRR